LIGQPLLGCRRHPSRGSLLPPAMAFTDAGIGRRSPQNTGEIGTSRRSQQVSPNSLQPASWEGNRPLTDVAGSLLQLGTCAGYLIGRSFYDRVRLSEAAASAARRRRGKIYGGFSRAHPVVFLLLLTLRRILLRIVFAVLLERSGAASYCTSLAGLCVRIWMGGRDIFEGDHFLPPRGGGTDLALEIGAGSPGAAVCAGAMIVASRGARRARRRRDRTGRRSEASLSWSAGSASRPKARLTQGPACWRHPRD
jgi:hypothetical protein